MGIILKYDDFINEWFNKLPNFEFDSKLKKIIINVEGDKVEAYVGAWEGYESESDGVGPGEYKNTYYFKSDKENADKLKEHNIISVESVNDKNRIIIFKKTNDELLTCTFKVKFFSKSELNDWKDVEEGGYITWKL